MSASGKEIEVKFFLAHPERLCARLDELGAQVSAPRVHEVNLRFDTPTGELTRSGRMLRLRRDSQVRLTYKGPGEVSGGARLRQELEFTVGDLQTAWAVFEALGYQVMLMYEKYRTTYALGGVLVTLDEMPYGHFAEIEGPDGASIQAATQALGLDWERRNLDSYVMLFEAARAALGFTFRDLSFENFRDLPVSPQALGVYPADNQS